MKTHLYRSISISLLALFFAQSSFATCGGGGGGGGGGSNNGGGGGGTNAPGYVVPWDKTTPSASGLLLFLFPATSTEVQNASLKESRILALRAQQCVAMVVGDPKANGADKLIGQSTLPVAILAKGDGSPINKVENTSGKLKVADVEKLVDTEMNQRKAAISEQTG